MTSTLDTLDTLDIDALLGALREVTGERSGPISLHEPFPRGREKEYLCQCVDENALSAKGPFGARFERALADFIGCGHVVATVNGTAALHLCLLLAGVEPGDEVLVPSLTFVATANAILYCGAVPHFADVDSRTLGLDPGRLEEHLAAVAVTRDGRLYNRSTGRRIALVVPMHTFGQPVDLDPLLAVCARYGLGIVEDATNALGTRYKGRHAGTFGKLGAFSFNGNKIITTGGGGAVVTDDRESAERARHLASTAKLPHSWAFLHDEVGYNYRLPELNAALGCAQIEQLPRFLAAKRELAERYRQRLDGVSGVRFFAEGPFARSNYWLCALLLDESRPELRDQVLERMHRAGFLARPVWTPLHQLPMLAGCPRMPLPVTEDLANRIINIPSSVSLVLES